jgi:HK97 family phage major capsid protein
MNVRELKSKRAALISQARAMLDKADTETRDLTVEEQTGYDALQAQIDKLHQDITRREKLEAQEQALDHTDDDDAPVTRGAPNFNRKTKLGETEASALAYFVRSGDKGAIENRASNNTGMNVTTNADGLYAVPTGHFQNIIAKRDELMLARQLGVQEIAGVGLTVNVPLDDETDGEFITKSEMGDDNSTNVFDRDAPALGTAAMTLVKYTKKIELTDELLQDEDSKLLAFIEKFVGRGQAKTHNQLLVTEAAANGTSAKTFASATVIAAGEPQALYYSLPDPYVVDGEVAWLMKRTVEGELRALQGTDFLYMPTPAGTTNGMRRELLGAPVFNSNKMPETVASAKSLMVGNWYYMGLREGPGMSFLRDPFTVDGKVILKYYFRCVYKVLQAEAIIYGVHPSA